MGMNGEGFVGRAEFDRHVSTNDSEIGSLNEEFGGFHALMANFLDGQKKRDQLFTDELTALRKELTGEVRKTQDSFHELEEVTSKTKIESLRVKLAEEKESRRELKRWIRIGVQLLAAAAGGGTFWEIVRNAFLHK